MANNAAGNLPDQPIIGGRFWRDQIAGGSSQEASGYFCCSTETIPTVPEGIHASSCAHSAHASPDSSLAKSLTTLNET